MGERAEKSGLDDQAMLYQTKKVCLLPFSSLFSSTVPFVLLTEKKEAYSLHS